MTLITYPTRVHFADDVLEEALHSELERAGATAPLLVMPDALTNPELEERVRAGLPPSATPHLVTYLEDSDLSAIVKNVVALNFEPDAIVAFGAARAIELGRKCRYAMTQKRKKRLAMYAIPGVDGLPGPCTRNLESWRSSLPTVLICDPTVALDAGQIQCERASVLSLVRCCESYLANAFNPPADGMALDGVNRCVINLPKIATVAGVDLQRELMAASLNAALSQEKGIGPALAMSAVLVQAGDGLDEADVARLVLPSVIRAQTVDAEKADALLKVLGQDGLGLGDAMGRVLAVVDGPASLSGMGIRRKALESAAQAAVSKAGFAYDTARQVLDEIYEDATQ